MVSTEETWIESEIDASITQYGMTIEVYPFLDVGTVNTYGQKKAKFHEPIEVTCRCIRNPTVEEISILGSEQEVDVMLVFSRSELVRKFPDRNEHEWIDENAQFIFEDKRYKVIKVHHSGRIATYDHVIIVGGKNLEGKLGQ